MAATALASTAVAQVMQLGFSLNGTAFDNQSAESIVQIIVSRFDDVTVDLQKAINKAGKRVEIVFDTEACELFGLKIVDKKYVSIKSVGDVAIRLPAKTYKQSDRSLNVFRILDCKTVISDARITFDGSAAKFSRKPKDMGTSSFCFYVQGTGALVDIRNVTNKNNGFGGVYVRSKSENEPGYRKVQIRDLESYNSVLNIAEVRGGHRTVLIEDVYAEDPNCKSIYGLNSSEVTVRTSSDVTLPDLHPRKVIFRRIYSRYAASRVQMKQACKDFVMEDVTIEDRGYDGNGKNTPIKYQGGPATKTDNVYWHGPTSNRITRFRTINTNKDQHYLSAWVGQAGDQNITFSDCDFDARVVMAGGGGVPKRPGKEGWSRLGVIRDSVFRAEVRAYGRGRIENCRFMAPTIVDPDIPTSQEDDFDKSFGPPILGLTMGEGMQVIDCDFFAANILLNGDVDYQIDSPKFFGDAKLVANKNFSGTCNILHPQNLHVTSYPNSTDDAGSITVIRPTGTYKEDIDGTGSGGAVKVKIENEGNK